MAVNIDVNCAGCGHNLPREYAHSKIHDPCPHCGSIKKRIGIAAEENVEVHDSIRIREKDPTLPSKKKVRKEHWYGDDYSEKYGKFMDKKRVIDKRQDKYEETVTDPDTGKIVHHCEEPLSKHTGHGSAKKKTN